MGPLEPTLQLGPLLLCYRKRLRHGEPLLNATRVQLRLEVLDLGIIGGRASYRFTRTLR
ncbi:hypothetical protein HNR17_002389 [Galbitalea soli]|nr:hypothetical protein [Galbitalea soli]